MEDRRRRREREEEESSYYRRSSKRDRGKERESSRERAARKAAKKALRAEEDANVPEDSSKFVWVKKNEKEKKSGISASERARRERGRREEAKEELEKLAKRRAEREIEQQLREVEAMRMQREADLAQLGDWEVKEDEFHLEQAKKRAEIRIKENRAKPIDILAINMRLAESNEEEDVEDIGIEVDVEEPYHIFDNLVLEEVEELHRDIQFYLSLEKNQNNIEFWNAMIVVAEDRLNEMRSNAHPRGRTGYDSVSKEAAKMFVGKSYDELGALQTQIQKKLGSGEPMDVEYWEGVMKALTVWKAKAKLNKIHQAMLTKRLDQLRTMQRLETLKEQNDVVAALAGRPVAKPAKKIAPVEEELEDEPEEAEQEIDLIPYERSMSPVPFETLTREDRELRQVDPEVDREEWHDRREKVRMSVLQSQQQTAGSVSQIPEDDADAASALYSKEASKPADLDELVFNTEAEVAKTTYLWQDKYRPRKPRYFNRVHTGYEWNKYNQTHYDTDNPPPKVVQGYKFNIFYPDVIDKSRTPTYKIEKEPGTAETVLIRFIGGPPYEDIAFRVVNREWEYSHKKGFKSSFDRGVLQLHFHFKRNFYRK